MKFPIPARRAWIAAPLGLFCVAGGLLTAGCPSASNNKDSAPTALASGAPASPLTSSSPGAATAFRAALAIDTGGVDDKSFNAASWAGLERAGKEFDLGPEGAKYVEAHEVGDYETILSSFAGQNYDLVFAGSYAFQDALKDVAPQFPKIKFAIIDCDAPDLPNCVSLQFKSEQATFLAGYLAASVSKTGTIGFIGGKDVPLIKMFEAGYDAGAKTANPAIKVLSTYTGAWDDDSKGKQQAEQQFGSGADVIFHAAGKCGLGVIKAAQEKGVGFYAIGCDSDQDALAPGRVLTSVMKHVDVAVYDTVKRTRAGAFKPGKQVYGLKDGGVGLTAMPYTKKDVPPAVFAHLDALTKLINDGKVTPPTTPEALASFQPPKL